MKKIQLPCAIYFAMWILLTCSLTTVTIAVAPVPLGHDSSFAALAGSAITVTGSGDIFGDMGISPGSSFTPGNPPVIVHGNIYLADSIAALAQVSLTTAYIDAAGRPGASTVGTELGGTTPPPGVYNSAAGTFGITGTLTLDALGDSSAVWIFQAASTLITADASKVILAGGAKIENIFWQVGSSATLGTNSDFKGTILAQIAITSNTGAKLTGRALARTGAVTLDHPFSTISSIAIPPIFANPPHLKIFIGYGLDSAFNMEDFNSGGRGSSYSLPTNFLSLGTTIGSYISEASYGSATSGINLYQITNDVGTSSDDGKIKYSTYKIKKLPQVVLRPGGSWAINMENFTIDSSNTNVIPLSFGNGDSIVVSDTSQVNAIWSDTSTITITAMGGFNSPANVDIIAAPIASGPYGDIDKERIGVYPALGSSSYEFSSSSDTTNFGYQTPAGVSVLGTLGYSTGISDPSGNVSHGGVLQVSFNTATSGIKITPKFSNWLANTPQTYYTLRVRVLGTSTVNNYLQLLYNGNPGVSPTDVQGYFKYSMPTVWTYFDIPVNSFSAVSNTPVMYPQLVLKANGATGTVYIDEMEIFQATPTLIGALRYLTADKYVGGYWDSSNLTTQWAIQSLSGSANDSVANGTLFINTVGASTLQSGLKFTASSTSGQVYTVSANVGRQAGMHMKTKLISGTPSVTLTQVQVNMLGASGPALGTQNGDIAAAAEIGRISDRTLRLAFDAHNANYQVQFIVKSAGNSIIQIDNTQADIDNDDPNYGDETLFP